MTKTLKQDTSKTKWFTPTIIPEDKAVISGSKITLPRKVAESFPDQRAAVGINKGAFVVFLKPDRNGYKIQFKKRGRPWMHVKSMRFSKELLAMTKGERMVCEVVVMSDGSVGCYL